MMKHIFRNSPEMVGPITHHPWKSTHKNQVLSTNWNQVVRLEGLEFSRAFTTPLHIVFPFLHGSWKITHLGSFGEDLTQCKCMPFHPKQPFINNHLYCKWLFGVPGGNVGGFPLYQVLPFVNLFWAVVSIDQNFWETVGDLNLGLIKRSINGRKSWS